MKKNIKPIGQKSFPKMPVELYANINLLNHLPDQKQRDNNTQKWLDAMIALSRVDELDIESLLNFIERRVRPYFNGEQLKPECKVMADEIRHALCFISFAKSELLNAKILSDRRINPNY